MGKLIIDLVINFFIGILFIKVSLKFGWNKRLWRYLQRHKKIKNDIVFYLVYVFIIILIVPFLCRSIGIDHKSISYKIINSITFSLCLSCMPRLPELFLKGE